MRTVAGALAAPAGLFVLALAVRLIAAGLLDFAPSEGSAYYVSVARNLVEGRGLVSDSIWSYATPPLVLPKPAFELWMPLASLIASIPMGLLGSTSLATAQLSSAVVGALVAPLTWAIARDAARRHGLGVRRTRSAAVAAGLAAGSLGPLVLAAMGPDSSTPFTVLVLAGCLAVPGALAGRLTHAAALGGLLALAYLSRQEAIYLGGALLVCTAVAARRLTGRRRAALVARAVGVPVAVAALVIAPWLARQLAAFGTLFPGQALENVYLTRNEEIFAYLERPTAAGFLGQGAATLGRHIGEAFASNLVEVLLLPAAPLTLMGMVALWALRRSPAIRSSSPLAVLLLAGALTYVASSVLVPVATRWGTFMHAAGPLLAGLVVVAALWSDVLVERIGRARRWAKPNVLIPSLLVLGLGLPLMALQVGVLAGQAAAAHDDIRGLAAAVAAQPEAAADPAAPIITDHPIWLAELTRRPALVLPDESPRHVWQLARDFGAPLVAVLGDRGRYPAIAGSPCFTERAPSIPAAAASGTGSGTAGSRPAATPRVFVPAADCAP